MIHVFAVPHGSNAVPRLQVAIAHLTRHRWRDVALAILSSAAVALSYWIASDWPPVTLATVIAVSGSTAMHARLAMGRGPTLVQICLSAAVLYAVGAPLMLVTVAVISGVTAGDLIAHSTGRLSVLRAGVGMGVAVTTVVILEKIRVAFTEALMAMHHRRMTYPPSSAAPRQPRRMALVPRLLGRSR